MTIQANVVYPYGLAQLKLGARLITLTDVRFEETYGGVIEGAPRPETDAARRSWYLGDLEKCWGERATLVVPPEVVEVQSHGELIRRMPAVACAAWLKSEAVTDAGAASELVLVWWTESLELPVGPTVERALAGVEWEQVAGDFEY
jgi:hypothetical protein